MWQPYWYHQQEYGVREFIILGKSLIYMLNKFIKTEPYKTPHFTISQILKFPILMHHKSHSFWNIHVKFMHDFTTYVSHNQQFVTINILCSLNRMGWWWLSWTGNALPSGWFWHILHTFVLCRTSTGYTSRSPVQAPGRDWHDIEQRRRKSYIWSSSWHEIPRHGGLRYGAKNQLLYCTLLKQEAEFCRYNLT